MSRTEIKKKPKTHRQTQSDSSTRGCLNGYPSSFPHFSEINKDKYNRIYLNKSFKNVMKSITDSKIKKLILYDASSPLKKGKKKVTSRGIYVAKEKNIIEEKKKNDFIDKIVGDISLFDSTSFQPLENEDNFGIDNKKISIEKENKKINKEDKNEKIIKKDKSKNKKESNANIINFSMMELNTNIKKNHKKILHFNSSHKSLYQKDIKKNNKLKLDIDSSKKTTEKDKNEIPLLGNKSNNMSFLLESYISNNTHRFLRKKDSQNLQCDLISAKAKTKGKKVKSISKKLIKNDSLINNNENKPYKKRGRKPKKFKARKPLMPLLNISDDKISGTDKDKSLELKKFSSQEKSTYLTTEKDRNSDNLLDSNSNEVILNEKGGMDIEEDNCLDIENDENKEKEEYSDLNLCIKKDIDYFNKEDQFCNNNNIRFVGRKRALSNDFGNLCNNNNDSFDMSLLNNNNNKDSTNFNNFNNSLLSPFLITQREQNSNIIFNSPFDWNNNKNNFFDQSMFEAKFI